MCPRPRFDKLDADTRLAILEAATAEFAQHGFEGASYNQIIERSGVSKGAMYYYFDDKADLFGTVLRHAFTSFANSVGGMALGDIPNDDFWGEFSRLNRACMDYAMAEPVMMDLVKSIYRAWMGADTGAIVQEAWVTARGFISSLLERGQQFGAIRTDLPLDLLVHLTMAMGQANDVWLLERWETLDFSNPEEIMETLERLYREVLGSRGE